MTNERKRKIAQTKGNIVNESKTMKKEHLPIRCLLLAAGLGTRLRPLTNHKPKCLVEIGGRPILGWWINHLQSIKCSSVIVNTHYHAEQVSAFLKKTRGMEMMIEEQYERKLLGTAGTLMRNEDYFKGSKGLLIHADNATDTDLNKLIEAHEERPKGCLITMLTFETENPQSCGIVR